jgi:hypothetical protein
MWGEERLSAPGKDFDLIMRFSAGSLIEPYLAVGRAPREHRFGHRGGYICFPLRQHAN